MIDISRTRVIVPRNFIVDKGSSFKIGKNCRIIEPTEVRDAYLFNVFLQRIKTDIHLENADIYLDMSKAEFYDKLDSVYGVRKSLLL